MGARPVRDEPVRRLRDCPAAAGGDRDEAAAARPGDCGCDASLPPPREPRSPRSRWPTSSPSGTGRRSSSRFGPTGTEKEPPPCDSSLTAGTTARIELHLTGEIDGRSIGGIDLAGDRSGGDFRWLAYAATSTELGLHGAARIGTDAWVREPFGGWRRAELSEVADATVDIQALETALTLGTRAAAELHGVDVIEGARARHCRIAIDGPTFRDAFPVVDWLIGDANMTIWRGEIDYWIFTDGELGRVVGSVNGDAGAIREGALQATIRVDLTATDRGGAFRIDPPSR